jgi:hypothetical protein
MAIAFLLNIKGEYYRPRNPMVDWESDRFLGVKK